MTFKHEDVIEKMEIQDKAGMFSGKNAAETMIRFMISAALLMF